MTFLLGYHVVSMTPGHRDIAVSALLESGESLLLKAQVWGPGSALWGNQTQTLGRSSRKV